MAAAISEAHRQASFVGGDRVIFNVKGNDYRLIVAIRYRQQIMYARFVGTHAEYERSMRPGASDTSNPRHSFDPDVIGFPGLRPFRRNV